MNIDPQWLVIGGVVAALGLLVGLGGAMVGLFVLRVEHVEAIKRIESLEETRLEDRRRRDD